MTVPTPYPPRAIDEIRAINTLKSILDPNQIIADIHQLDTVPDVDGHLDVLDDGRRPTAKLEVQVKKLPDDYGATPKLQVKLGLFGYASLATNNPVFLIGVDINHEKAYWFHVQPGIVENPGQETITVNFPTTQIIDRGNKRYIAEWLAISRETQRKLREFSRLEQGYTRLSAIVNAAGGLTKAEFREIHTFLDVINSFLDGDFSLIKRRYYPNAWKVGLAYHEYNATSASYAIYPIPYDLNDPQIKEVDLDIRNELVKLNGMWAYSDENPIKRRPANLAIEFLEGHVQQVLKYRLLEHSSETIAIEFLIAFIDRFAEQMGLSLKERYSSTEVEDGFYHLLIWTDQATKLLLREGRYARLSDLTFGKQYFDPELLWSLVATSKEELEI